MANTLNKNYELNVLFKRLSDTARRAGRFKQHLGEVLCIGIFKSQWGERRETIFYAQGEFKSAFVNIPSDTSLTCIPDSIGMSYIFLYLFQIWRTAARNA